MIKITEIKTSPELLPLAQEALRLINQAKEAGVSECLIPVEPEHEDSLSELLVEWDLLVWGVPGQIGVAW